MELRNWRMYDEAVEAGYEAAKAALSTCSDRLRIAIDAAQQLAGNV